ncbi:DUF4263 domain-containing protein [Leptospira bandrabouensis]|uniref:DUF4263 domain-containing protein n=1 Tax=Leptospira bandrabouensis TaxID=2484903 RepID=UPI001EEBA4B1|nr:DUF4263 domain-containing protein [Leptospira bandrabouensis]MCG6154066.1 DUF4263 domain-containing protein [Leptospira bandrabouensis]
MDKKNIDVAIEDHFIIIKLTHDKLIPEGEILDNFIDSLLIQTKKNHIVLDIPDPDLIFNDTIYFLETLKERSKNSDLYNLTKFTIITPESARERMESELDYFGLQIRGLKDNKYRLNYNKFDLLPFYDNHENCHVDEIDELKNIINKLNFTEFTEHELNFIKKRINQFRPSQRIEDFFSHASDLQMLLEFNNFDGTSEILKKRIIQEFITKNLNRSLLCEFFIDPDINNPTIIPCLSGGIENVYYSRDSTLIRPTIFASKINDSQAKKIQEFTDLIKKKNVSEHELQLFLENNPFFFQALNYKTMRPQVILERDDGTSLRPDFFLQPYGSDWWEILDLKLPNKFIVVGGRDRKHFSSAVTEGLAQIREYQSYFDDTKYSRRIEEKYGIRCYKPKIKLVIGKDSPDQDDLFQLQRLMTSYSSEKAEILTFDRLIRIAFERLPI